MNLDKKRWIVLIAGCLVNLCIGSLYSWSVFSTPMADYLNNLNGLTGAAAVTGSSLSIVFTLTNIVAPTLIIFGGLFNDRFNPKWIIFVGGIFFGLGMMLSSIATSAGFLCFGYSLFCGMGSGLSYSSTVNTAVSFFPDKRGLIGGICTATYGFSSVITPLIANRLINTVGIIKTFRILGVAYWILICGSAMFLTKCPADYVPAGWNPPLVNNRVNAKKDYTTKEMVCTSDFYIMFLLLLCGAFAGSMAISQAAQIAQTMVGMTASAAAVVVSVLAMFNAAGRVLSGFVSDKIGRGNTLLIACIAAIAATLALIFFGEGNTVVFVICISVIGYCFGSFLGVYPGYTVDRFGSKYSGLNYGIMFIGFGVAGSCAPLIATKIFSSLGSYRPAFVVAAAINVCGLILSRVVIKKQI